MINFNIHRILVFTGSDSGIIVREDAIAEATIGLQIVLPPAPTYLSATAVSSSQITLSWYNLPQNEQGFRIERRTETTDFLSIGSTPENDTTYQDTIDLAEGSYYYYRVYAFIDSINSAFSNSAGALTLPATPTNLAVDTTVSPTQLHLSWVDNSSHEDGFLIERRMVEGQFEVVAAVSANDTSYLNDLLQKYYPQYLRSLQSCFYPFLFYPS